MLFVNSYKSWGDIEKAATRSNELAKEAWPDENERNEFFKKQSEYYDAMHSDEIYSILPWAKLPEEKPWGQIVGYVRGIDGSIIELCTPVEK